MVDDSTGAHMDHAAAQPLDPRVRHAMCDALETTWGNPEGLHDAARVAAEAVDGARSAVAALIGARASEIIFTAGDVEARNIAVHGLWSAVQHRGSHIVTTSVEHDAIAHSCRALERLGAEVTRVGVDEAGRVDPFDIASALRDDTVLVSIPHAQAEIGTVYDVTAICAAVRARSADVSIHVDASATAGLLPIDVSSWGCDAVSFGGGTMLGPRWMGVLWVREGTRLHPLTVGGAQEGGKRPGHHDVAGIVGLGVAATLAAEEGAVRADAMRTAAVRLTNELISVDGVRLHGPPDDRLPGHVQVGVDGVEGEALTVVLAAAGIACSPGSACSSAGKSSAILEAIGLRPPATLSAVLFTVGPETTDADVAVTATAFRTAVARLRAMGVRT